MKREKDDKESNLGFILMVGPNCLADGLDVNSYGKGMLKDVS